MTSRRAILELREIVWREGFSKLEPGQYDVQFVRDMAGSVGIPPTPAYTAQRLRIGFVQKILDNGSRFC